MAITILRNQPIDFNTEDELDCGCTGSGFCQLIDPSDPTQFELSSTDTISNGDFAFDETGWSVTDSLVIELIIVNESEPGACDGSINIYVPNRSDHYTSYIDGEVPKTDFGGYVTYIGLCAGCYFFTIVDDDGRQGSVEQCIVNGLICSDYVKTTDFVDVNTLELNNCKTTDFQ